MMKILAILGTTINHPQLKKSCRQTWLNDIDHIFATDIVDGPNQFSMSSSKDYISHIQKDYNGFLKALADYPNYDYYILTCDDTIVNVKNLYNCINDLKGDYIYGKKLNHWAVKPSLQYVSGGAGILVSRDILNKWVQTAMKIDFLKSLRSKYFDVQFGLCRQKAGIPVCNIKGFQSQGQLCRDNNLQFMQMITYHHLSLQQMYNIYRRWNS